MNQPQSPQDSLPTKIIALLTSQPGLKARQISDTLNLDRTQVNAILYGELRLKVIQDNQYRWRLRSPANSGESQQTQTRTDTLLAKLCDYYLECLSYDDLGGLSVFASNNFGDPDYVELTKLPMVSDTPIDIFETESARKLLNKVQRERSRVTLVIGYPIKLTKIHSSRSNWEGFVVEPIFLFGFQEDPANQRSLPVISEELPQINSKAIRSLTHAESSQITEEIIQLSDELGLAGISNDFPDLDEVIPRLQLIRPEWEWKEHPDPQHIGGDLAGC